MKRIWRGTVENGKLTLDDAPHFAALIRTLDKKRVDVTLEEHRKTRTGEQNRWFHGCIVPLLAEHCGYDLDEMKEALKIKFLSIHADGPLPTVRRTRDLSTKEFADFCERCQRLGAELGVSIPSPRDIDL